MCSKRSYNSKWLWSPLGTLRISKFVFKNGGGIKNTRARERPSITKATIGLHTRRTCFGPFLHYISDFTKTWSNMQSGYQMLTNLLEIYHSIPKSDFIQKLWYLCLWFSTTILKEMFIKFERRIDEEKCDNYWNEFLLKTLCMLFFIFLPNEYYNLLWGPLNDV